MAHDFRFQVLTTVTMKSTVTWVVMKCVEVNGCFGGMYFLHLRSDSNPTPALLASCQLLGLLIAAEHTICSSEMLMNYWTAQCHIPEDENLLFTRGV
jgi:hypothetical protein